MKVIAPVIAYIAIGSNLGDRGRNIRNAIDALRQTPGVVVRKISSLIENPPVGMPEGAGPFLNGAAELQTTLPAMILLSVMLNIEAAQGRTRRQRWEPRPIDLDLLLYGSRSFNLPALKIPHPLMHEREFVLQPLAEIAPDVVHPQLHRTMNQLLVNLRGRA